MVFCQECGKKNSEGANFCESCGAKLLNTTLTEQDAKIQRYKELLIKSYEQVIEKCGGNYQDWYYVLCTEVTTQPRSSIKGTTLPDVASHKHSGGLIRIHENYLEYAEINNEKNLISKNRIKKTIEIPTFYDIDDEYIRLIPFKSFTHTWGSKIFLQNGQNIFMKEIEFITLKPTKIKLEKPSFLKGQNNFLKSLNKTYKNYLNNKNNLSKVDELKKLKNLLDDGDITQEEYELFKKDIVNS